MDIRFHINKYYNAISNFLQQIFLPKVNVLSNEESLQLLIEKKLSISRYGDGEVRLMNNESIEFQQYESALSSRLREIAVSKSTNHAVCLSPVFGSLNEFHSKERFFWRKHLASYRKIWIKHIDVKHVYLSTFLTRPYMPYEDKTKAGAYFLSIKAVWENKKILLVEGMQTRFGVNNPLLDNAASVERILCPSTNAFSFYNDILEAARASYTNHLVLVALGPTATVLCYDLSLKGIQAIDIGHLDIEYEWFLSKAQEKIEIKGKYTNEAVYDKTTIEDVKVESYQTQIVKIIK